MHLNRDLKIVAQNIMMSLILGFKGTKYEQETFFVKRS